MQSISSIAIKIIGIPTYQNSLNKRYIPTTMLKRETIKLDLTSFSSLNLKPDILKLLKDISFF